MFGYMFDVIAWGIVVSFFAIGLAFLAEGRGSHAARLLLGKRPGKEDLDVFSSLARDEGDWRVVGTLSDIEQVPTERSALESAGVPR